MGEVEQSKNFASLPCEVALKFFKYLGHADKKNCRSVCRRWRCFLDSSYFAFRPRLKDMSSLMDFFNSCQIMDKVTLENMTDKLPSNPFPEIRCAIVGCKNLPENITTFLRHGCNYATSLTLAEFSLGHITLNSVSKILRDKTWTHLAELNISVSMLNLHLVQGSANHLEAVILVLKSAKVPKVKKLGFEFVHNYESHRSGERGTRFQNICLAFYEFMAGHAKSLKILNCRIATNRNRKFNLPKIPQTLKNGYKADLNLESCSLALSGLGEIENLVLPELFGYQLKTLALRSEIPAGFSRIEFLNPLRIGNMKVLENNLEQVIGNNRTTLRNATFWWFPSLNLSFFPQCSSLESVDIGITYGNFPFPTLPTDIFESSCITLRKIVIHYGGPVYFSWFRNCVNLEEIDINVRRGRQCLERPLALWSRSKMNLKKITVIISDADNGCAQEIQQIIDRSGPRLEYLKLDLVSHPNLQPISLIECTNAKSIIVRGNGRGMDDNVRYYFRNLTHLECDIVNAEMAKQIVANMENLITVGVVTLDEGGYLSNVKTLLQLRKVESIELHKPPYIFGNDTLEATREFCNQHSGLKLIMKKSAQYQYRPIVTVDRSIYKTNQNS